MKMTISTLVAGIFFSLGSAAAMAGPVYFGLTGQPRDVSQDQLFGELKSAFSAPTEKMGTHVKAFLSYQVDGANRFSLGLITEALDTEGAARLGDFVDQLERTGFHGYPVKFRQVARIRESVRLYVGIHKAGGEGNGFDPRSETDKDFSLSSVSAWEAFTDTLAEALAAPKPENFQNYLMGFLGGPVPFQSFAETVLAHNDMVLAEASPTIELADGSKVGPENEGMPFFYIPFVRNCWASGFENGVCYKRVSR